MRERLGREAFIPHVRDAPRLAEPVGEQVQLPLRTEAVDEPFFAVDDVFRPV
jgi:hypothetical protein